MARALIVEVEKRFASGAVVAARFETGLGSGAILVLFGPSGAGKTTVVRCIAGLERPDRGRIVFDDETWFDDSGRWVDPQRRFVGYLGQEPALFPHLTVRGNVGYGLTGSAVDRERRIAEMLTLVDIGPLDRRRPHELSGGQAQRVALARALAPAPRLLVLDEPFASLDAPARARLRTDLRSIVRRVGIAVVLVTHDRRDAIALGDELVVLAEGRVRQAGPVQQVFRRPADLIVARTVGVESVIPARIAGVDNGLVKLDVDGATLRAVDEDVDANRRDVFACIRAEDVVLQRASAADVSARNHLAGRIVAI